MQDLASFLGRFHVLALHLPVGIVIAAVALDWLARRPRYAELARASGFLWGAAAVTAVATAVLGLLHFAEGGFTGPSADAHRFYGIVTALGAVGVWWLAARARGAPPRAARLAAGVAMLALVSVTGHYGGNLTHGSTYLVEYAPSFLRSLLGAGERRTPVTSVAAADPYADVVQPLLERRCGTCHNDEKRNGGFSVSTYDFSLVGGDTGRAVVPGDLTGSELFYRVTLPHDDEAFMPAEGKTPLTAAQVEILRWWIESGAPRDTTVGTLAPPPAIEALLGAELGLTAAEEAAPSVAAVDGALVERLLAAGFLARPVAQDDARLVVSVHSPGSAVGADALAALAAAAPAIADLNLADTALDDAGLAALGALPEATHLRLSRNRLSDASLVALAALPKLAHLNLYGNALVTDRGLEALGASTSLRDVFLWQTGVTDSGVAKLRTQRPELEIDVGASPMPASASLAR
jgi:uncharacterized membrane protein